MSCIINSKLDFVAMCQAPDILGVSIVQYQAINNSHSKILRVTVRETVSQKKQKQKHSFLFNL